MEKTQKRRRKEQKTSYKKRLGMLKSENGRIVIRKTNRYLIVQYVVSEEAKDKVILGISSRNLKKYGWPEKLDGSLKSIPASYLTGYLFGKLVQEKKIKEGILDLGIQRNIHGGRLYAVLKGIVESGFEIAHKEKVFPSKERLQGKHLNQDVQKIIDEVKKKIK
jgi:large subunit ribosomal protein L18